MISLINVFECFEVNFVKFNVNELPRPLTTCPYVLACAYVLIAIEK